MKVWNFESVKVWQILRSEWVKFWKCDIFESIDQCSMNTKMWNVWNWGMFEAFRLVKFKGINCALNTENQSICQPADDIKSVIAFSQHVTKFRP